ncbi:MAG: hypothetical protein PHU25_21860 [Deltaproteobacteria bacterium]|nr:hypothetical protein [Deltaproteobacteria bacterium]
MQRHLAIALAVLVALAFLGCGRKGESSGSGKGDSTAALPGTTGRKVSALGAAERASRSASLEQGKFRVLGLTVPDGMHPVTGVFGFYRYAGIFPEEQVSTFVRSQLAQSKEEREGHGHLFRQAIPRNPRGGDSSRRLAIRVSKAPGGGAFMDVWVESRPDRERAAGGDIGTPSAMYLPMTQAQKDDRKKMKAETFRVMEKVSRNEPLSPEDLNSQFFE